MKILVLGKPASGKGTISQMLMNEDPTIFQLSTGDLLRKEQTTGSEMGNQIRDILAVGGFATDEMIYKLMGKTIEEKKDVPLIFDGYPRTVKQAIDCVENNIVFDKVFLFEVDDETVKERVVNRRVHLASGRVYNTVSKPPKVDGIDDVTGEPLIQRDDDTVEVLEKRLENYKKLTAPIADYLRSVGYKVEVIDGKVPLAEQFQQVKDSLAEVKSQKANEVTDVVKPQRPRMR